MNEFVVRGATRPWRSPWIPWRLDLLLYFPALRWTFTAGGLEISCHVKRFRKKYWKPENFVHRFKILVESFVQAMRCYGNRDHAVYIMVGSGIDTVNRSALVWRLITWSGVCNKESISDRIALCASLITSIQQTHQFSKHVYLYSKRYTASYTRYV